MTNNVVMLDFDIQPAMEYEIFHFMEYGGMKSDFHKF